MFDRLRIRSKLIALLAVPLAALLVLAGIVGWSRQADADESAADRHLLEVAALASTAAHEIQVETELAMRYAVTRDDADAERWRAQGLVADRTIDATRADLSTLDTAALDRNALATVNLLGRSADFPRRVRSTVAGEVTEWPAVLTSYRNISDSYVDLSVRLSNNTRRPELNAGARSWSLAVKIEADVAEQRAILTGALSDGRFPSPESRLALQSVVAREAADVATTDTFAVAAVRDSVRTALSGNAVGTANALREEALDGGSGDLDLDVEVGAWRTASGEKLDRIRGAEVAAAQSVLDRAGVLTTAATRSARLFFVAALLAVLAVIALAAFEARRITRPLIRLTHAADALASEQLPRMVESLRNPAGDDVSDLSAALTPIDVTGDDEIGQLARSFNAVQTVTVDVAAEQAALLRKGIGDMFINLARRNQTLIDRQIEFLDGLEADEQDPDQLDNLFKLDHMATRMRRNAESLLVLAGAEPTRRRGRPVPLADVVRAAMGEVEDFNRIDLRVFDPVRLQSNASSDLAHLLSELMENATNFSPPDSRVEVVGRWADGGAYALTVTDRGIGMSVTQLAEANALLARPPLVGLSLSRSLGFIVIGRLAARYAIGVQLAPVAGGGVLAEIVLPTALVAGAAGDEPDPVTVPSATPIVEPPARRSQTPPLAALPLGEPDRIGARSGAGPAPGFPTRAPAPSPPRPPAAIPVAAGAAVPAAAAAARQVPSDQHALVEPLPGVEPASAPVVVTMSASASSLDATLVEPLLSERLGDEAPAPVPGSDPVDGRDDGSAATTPGGLPRRRAGGSRPRPGGEGGARSATKAKRSPEEVRNMLSAYRGGVRRGQGGDAASHDGSEDRA